MTVMLFQVMVTINGGNGVYAENASNLIILGNYVGLLPDGTTALANATNGINFSNMSDVIIGDGTTAGRNIIAGNDERAIYSSGTQTNISISGNYIGIDATGNLAVTNGGGIALGGRDAVAINTGTATNVTVLDNVIGGYDGSAIEFWDLSSGSNNLVSGNNIGVGADNSSDITSSSGFSEGGMHVGFASGSGSIGLTIGGLGAGEGNLIANGSNEAINVRNRSNITILGNVLRDNGEDGVRVEGSGEAAIYSNKIYNNGGLGIDLNYDGVTDNDSGGGDGDTGPNELLNFPLINTISADGTTSVGYSVELDVPANTEGYRIEFFKNTSPDTTNGEGEIFLGFVDTGDHAGGAISYDGSFTSAVTVSTGDSISATTTRKTGATAYDITSEFAVNKTAQSSLVVTNTNDSGAGSLRAAITYANANTSENNITFDIDGAGPHTITPLTAFPGISDDGISIDGTTQAGATCGDLWSGTPHTLLINIDGDGLTTYGLTTTASNVTFSGLAIGGFNAAFVAYPSASNTQFKCNYVGLNPDGTANGNVTTGIIPHGTNTLIGGSNATDGNVISSNGSVGVSVGPDVVNFSAEGNFIGTDPTGTIARPNGTIGLNQYFGGTATWGDVRNNLISGNGTDGIGLSDSTVISGSSGDVIFAGNYIGVDRTGNTALPNGANGIEFPSGSISGVTIGGTSTADRNIISGNTGDGIALDTVSDIDILGNYIGLNAAGTASMPNGIRGIYADGVSTLNIGNGLASGRNVIVEPGDRPIRFNGGASTVSIDGNYLGTDVTGNTSLQNGTDRNEDAIVIATGTYTDFTITDNVMGGFGGDAVEMSVSGSITNLTFQGNNIGVGADGTTALPIAQDATVDGAITVRNSMVVNNMLIGGTGAGEGNIIANSGSSGIFITTSGATITGSVVGNTIYGNTLDGIAHQNDNSTLAIYANSIHSNGDLGIDLSNDGVIDNDSGDGDSGPNDLLNFPLINTISADGSTTVGYSVELDVPANTEGYRIEFFKNTSPDTTNGEGEIFLGFVDTGDHAGGAISYDGSFTSAVAVSTGDSISATSTRKTDATSYDITSEFAVNKTAQSSLVVTNTNDSGAGSLRAAITYANAAEDDITFNIAGSGVQTITLASVLPNITDDGISIDGTTQSGSSCGQLTTGTPHTLNIEVDGGGSDLVIFNVRGDNNSIKGIAVGNSQSRGLFVNGSDQLTLECSYWGLRADGLTASPLVTNELNGSMLINDSTNAQIINNAFSGNNGSSNDVGLTITDSVNGISMTGNLFGLGADGTTVVANTGEGLLLRGTNATIGGTTAATRNVFAGNGANGIYLGETSNSTLLGNYIGVDITGLTQATNGESGILVDTAASGITIGGTAAGAGNVISGNTGDGIALDTVSDIDILGNYFGLGVDGATDLGNGQDGIQIVDSSNVNIGDGTAAGRNVSSGNGQNGLEVSSTSNVAVNDNYFGTNAAGTAAVASDRWGIVLAAPNGSTTMSNITITNNVLSGNTIGGLDITANSNTVLGESVSASVTNNKIGVAADGTSPLGNGSHGIKNTSVPSSAVIGGNSASEYNIIAYNGLNGITMSGNDGATLAILGNRIFSNTNLGIDIDKDGVTANDNSSARPNESLNFPLINDFASDGNTGMTYDINLDVPAADYRIDFYRNSAADSSGYGEGEFHLGFVELTHSGGNQQYTGAFTANSAVVQGNFIAATTTRKTGSSAYDITSEFSLTTTTGSPTELTAVKSVEVYDPTSAGLYSLPGNDVISSLTVTNPGTSPADADSIVIIDAIPAEVTFYNGDIDDGGPHSNAVSFVQTGGANLTFTYAADVKFSNSGTRPNDMAGCTYTPSAGYDTNVTFLCLNPKGAMAAGNPDPTFTVSYRAKIK